MGCGGRLAVQLAMFGALWPRGTLAQQVVGQQARGARVQPFLGVAVEAGRTFWRIPKELYQPSRGLLHGALSLDRSVAIRGGADLRLGGNWRARTEVAATSATMTGQLTAGAPSSTVTAVVDTGRMSSLGLQAGLVRDLPLGRLRSTGAVLIGARRYTRQATRWRHEAWYPSGAAELEVATPRGRWGSLGLSVRTQVDRTDRGAALSFVSQDRVYFGNLYFPLSVLTDDHYFSVGVAAGIRWRPPWPR